MLVWNPVIFWLRLNFSTTLSKWLWTDQPPTSSICNTCLFYNNNIITACQIWRLPALTGSTFISTKISRTLKTALGKWYSHFLKAQVPRKNPRILNFWNVKNSTENIRNLGMTNKIMEEEPTKKQKTGTLRKVIN